MLVELVWEDSSLRSPERPGEARTACALGSTCGTGQPGRQAPCFVARTLLMRQSERNLLACSTRGWLPRHFLLTALGNWRLSQPSTSPLHAPACMVLVSVPTLATSCALHVPARADRPTGPPTVLRYGQVKHTHRWRDKDTRTDPVVPGRPCIHIHTNHRDHVAPLR